MDSRRRRKPFRGEREKCSGVELLNFTSRNENRSPGSAFFSTPKVENGSGAFLNESRGEAEQSGGKVVLLDFWGAYTGIAARQCRRSRAVRGRNGSTVRPTRLCELRCGEQDWLKTFGFVGDASRGGAGRTRGAGVTYWALNFRLERSWPLR